MFTTNYQTNSVLNMQMRPSYQSSINSAIKIQQNTSCYALSPLFLIKTFDRYQPTRNAKCLKFWEMLLIVATLHCLIFEVNCNPPLDNAGLFYTQQIKISNPVNNSYPQTLSVNRSYSGWSFTQSSVPDYYVSLSIQQINIKVDSSNNYLTFNITSKIVSQNSISIYFGVCQSNGSCFTSATIRMLAVDYDMNINSVPCNQVINNFFIQNAIMDNTTAYTSTSSQVSQNFSNSLLNIDSSPIFFIYINSFRLYQNITGNTKLGITNLRAYYGNQTSFWIVFKLDPINNSTQTFSVKFSVIIINNAFLSPSSNIYKIIPRPSPVLSLYRNHPIDSNNSNRTGYPIGQVLMQGMRNIFIQSNNFINLTSTIESRRVFGSSSTDITSTSFNDNIEMQWFIIQKQICPPLSPYYRIDNNESTSCHSSSCGDGYYTLNQFTCYQCQNPTCKSCSSNGNASCSVCDDNTRKPQNNSCNPLDGYYQNYEIVAGSCMQNCSTCSSNDSCITCQNNFYYSVNQTCLSCKDLHQNCKECSNTNGTAPSLCTQCNNFFYLSNDYTCLTCSQNIINCTECDLTNLTAICIQCQAPFLVKDNSCAAECGDGVVQSIFNEECDDGNLINSDGCNNKCKKQLNFTCQQFPYMNSTTLNTSQCIYTGQFQIISKYLEKFQTQNKVEFRFNLQPLISIVQSHLFAERMRSAFYINWNASQIQYVQFFKVDNGLKENGLFAVRFSYNSQWSSDIQLIFVPKDTNIKSLSFNYSRRLLQEELIQANINLINSQVRQQQTNSTLFSNNRRILPAVNQQFWVMLPTKSDNNLVMYSESYDTYNYSQYISYFLTCTVWMLWIVGLFFGKLVVVDFMMAIQIGALCSMTTGILTPGFSGMMLQNFVFFGFTGLYTNSYEDRSIYQHISPQLKSANLSVHAAQNLSLMFILLAVNILVSICAKIAAAFSDQKKFIFETICRYSLGQFNLYILLPFMLNGNLSSVIFIKSLLLEGQFNILDALATVLFNLFQIGVFALQIFRPKYFGEFRTEFLRYYTSQNFYMFVMIYTCCLSLIFGVLFQTAGIKYCCILPLAIYALILLYNKVHQPFLQKRHLIRCYILYGVMMVAILLVQIQNIVKANLFQQYLGVVILGMESILAVTSGYFIIQSIRIQGLSKLHAFRKHDQESNGKMALYDQDKQQVQFKIDQIHKNYYQNQSKLLKDIKFQCDQGQIDFYQEYSKLGKHLEAQASPKSKPKMSATKQDQIKISKLLKNSKMMKMFLHNYLINKEKAISYDQSENYDSFINIKKNKQGGKEDRYQDDQSKRILQKSETNKSVIKDDFPEQLITSYNVAELLKKQPTKKKRNDNQVTRNVLQQKNKKLLKKKGVEQQKLPVITYQLWLQQIQKEDQEIQRQRLKKLRRSKGRKILYRDSKRNMVKNEEIN